MRSGGTRAWRRLRGLVLARDGYRCTLRLAGCLGRADQVHHRLGVAVSGLVCAPELLAAACFPCNRAVSDPARHGDPAPRVGTRW